MEFRDLKKQYVTLREKIDGAIQDVCKQANYVSGKQVKDLEGQLAAYVGVRNCISCANGTDAITLVLMAWGIGKGDAVFVPDFTFFSTAECVALCGATPIYVDVDTQTFNMCPESLQRAIEITVQKGELIPKAIVPVDLFGMPADYSRITRVAADHNLLVMEDGAQGFGGPWGEKKVCSFGDVATTSFFPAKPLGCYGDGGAIFTDNDELARLLRSYAVHGKSPENKYDNRRIGLNSRLDTIQAAILNVKLAAFEEYELDRVNQAAIYYTERLAAVVQTPVIPSGYTSSWAQYTIHLLNETQRDKVQQQLREQQIPTMVYYPRTMSQQLALAYTLPAQPFQCEQASVLCKTVLSLPIHPYITSEEQDIVINAVKKALAN